ncbi:tetratricopeptide repeat protein [Amycolatopsis sp.]|uniref:tetratricopeptide repeat protein n=1 Tax=Amycolatopsis sp. TaxID=37632 RepID=UPI002D804146|nr:tetratricopeptide repeat protein [Amycolatopsis sp.]HET6710353.1 tetratricopeptide repeat protein [Amycolatopsis sp.]
MSALASAGGTSFAVAENVFINPRTTPGPAAVVEALHPGRDGHLFVGRAPEVDGLLRLLAPSSDTTKPVVVSAMAGMGGVGKTALAVHTAMLAAERGWCPGGVLLVDLHGYDAAPVRPAQVYASMLRVLGMPDERIPDTVDEQAGEYHRWLDRLADRGRPVLLVLDNVAEAAQVRDLLPRHREHRALVTTRDDIFDPAAVRRLFLDVLTEAEAIDLLIRTLRAADPADPRPRDEPDVIGRLVQLCGLLPLAVEIAAAILTDEPTTSIATLADQFADGEARVSGLRHGVRDVGSVIGFSYRRLAGRDPGAAALLPLLTLDPGPDLATETAAALAGVSTAAAATLLRTLRAGSLLRHTADGRWQLHDLIAFYARRHLAADVATAAMSRLVQYYLGSADAADTHLHALRGQSLPDRFAGRAQALAWFDAERANITALVALTHRTGRYRETCRLATLIAEYLRGRRHFADWITVAEHAAAAATALGNPQRIGAALNRLGFALCAVRRFDEAIAAHERARALYREFEDRHGEAQAANGLGLALSEVKRFREAVTAHRLARAIFRASGDRHGEAMAWNNLGIALCELKRFGRAIIAHRRARDLHAITGDGRGEALACNGLGHALRKLGRAAEAVAAHERARDLFREFDDPFREAQAWSSLGRAFHDVRRFDDAVTAHRRARDLFREFGDRPGETATSHDLGSALRAAGRFEEAIAEHRADVEFCRTAGDRIGEGSAWNRLGLAQSALKQFGEARAAHERAREILREAGDHHGEGAALNNLGIALRELGRFDEAAAAHRKDLDIYDEFGSRPGEGVVWNNLGIVLAAGGRTGEAMAAHQRALDLSSRNGDHQGRGMALIQLGHALSKTGRPADAFHRFTEAAAVFAEAGDEATAEEIRQGIPQVLGDGYAS